MRRAWLLALGAGACAPAAQTSRELPTGREPARVTAPVPSNTSPGRSPLSAELPPSPVPASAAPRACGELGCLRFDSADHAFEHVLQSEPRVLGIGEAHAQKGAGNVASSTKRFMDDMLPKLAGKASDLVIELWVSAGNCGTVEKQVEKQQRPVTESQAVTNQGEFVELGHRAKALGIQPHALVPSCDEYRAIASAGPSDVDRMLEMIATATARQIEALLAKRNRGMIVAYGGALHNDLAPRAGREHWSFGPRLDELTQGAYVELDLIVPEFVKDTESWRAFPWFSAYQSVGDRSGVLLFAPEARAFTLIFARAAPPD